MAAPTALLMAPRPLPDPRVRGPLRRVPPPPPPFGPHPTVLIAPPPRPRSRSWHMVDSQSFPFEVRSYPKLWQGAYAPSQRYTQADVASIVEYGRLRGVRVMVEFDMPGHADSWCDPRSPLSSAPLSSRARWRTLSSAPLSSRARWRTSMLAEGTPSPPPLPHPPRRARWRTSMLAEGIGLHVQPTPSSRRCDGYPEICPSPSCTTPLNVASNATFALSAPPSVCRRRVRTASVPAHLPPKSPPRGASAATASPLV